MSWTQPELDALKKAYAAGTLRVSFEGRSVEYGSAADLLSRIRIIEAEMAAQSGSACAEAKPRIIPQRLTLKHELDRPGDWCCGTRRCLAPSAAAAGAWV